MLAKLLNRGVVRAIVCSCAVEMLAMTDYGQTFIAAWSPSRRSGDNGVSNVHCLSLSRPGLRAGSAACVRGSASVRVGKSRVLELNKPGHNGKQEARGESAHQHTCNAFHRAHHSPHGLKKKVRRADCRIIGCRKVEGCFQGCKKLPAIKPCPQQNLRHVQADQQAGESHHEQKRAEKAELVNAIGELSFNPLDESGHAGALQQDCERNQNNRCAVLVKENHHRLVQCSTSKSVEPCDARGHRSPSHSEPAAEESPPIAGSRSLVSSLLQTSDAFCES